MRLGDTDYVNGDQGNKGGEEDGDPAIEENYGEWDDDVRNEDQLYWRLICLHVYTRTVQQVVVPVHKVCMYRWYCCQFII